MMSTVQLTVPIVLSVNHETMRWKGTLWLCQAREVMRTAALDPAGQAALFVIEGELDAREIGHVTLGADYAVKPEYRDSARVWVAYYVGGGAREFLGAELTERQARQHAIKHRVQHWTAT